jgi:hypothetical protein
MIHGPTGSFPERFPDGRAPGCEGLVHDTVRRPSRPMIDAFSLNDWELRPIARV